MSLIEQPALSRRASMRAMVTLSGVAVALPIATSLRAAEQILHFRIAPYMETLAAAVDRIIPETDTPGALAAGVPDYIASVFGDRFSAAQQDEFVWGLALLDRMAQDAGAASFLEGDAAAQDAILTKLDAIRQDIPPMRFWRALREMTIFGYYTSEAATKELAFEEIPGRLIGDLPYSEIGAAWLDRGA